MLSSSKHYYVVNHVVAGRGIVLLFKIVQVEVEACQVRNILHLIVDVHRRTITSLRALVCTLFLFLLVSNVIGNTSTFATDNEG